MHSQPKPGMITNRFNIWRNNCVNSPTAAKLTKKNNSPI
ncbi:hypothetical protein UUU_07230 [Klebsiella pneumoniae subsp. pneumoniae DSM 30104 = JCM 1662 = NBRC 14940]|nr:hypothetical protein UUU_07230 [Klebsiella pneumoniae subsp. pneumoniae DSM 30104 = JCM 1662 = NBRC 14940]